nr:hypothetical protein [Roseomonas sp. HF4]
MADQRQRALHAAREADRHRRPRPLRAAGEAPQLVDHRAGPVRLRDDPREPAPECRIALRGRHPLRVLGRKQDRLQRLPQFMRETRGQFPERREPARRLRARLRRPLGRDVEQVAHQLRAPIGAARQDPPRLQHMPPASVGLPEAPFDARPPLVEGRALEPQRAVGRGVAERLHQVVVAREFIGRPARHGLEVPRAIEQA